MNAIKPAFRALLVAALAVMVYAGLPQPAEAHCDTMNGPVVGAARTAVNTGSLLPVLQWVRKEDEDEIEQAFKLARKAREGGPDAKKLAERYFLETVVRVHRAAEGEPFTGLKPAAPPEPGVAEADEALRTGDVEPLARALGRAVADAVRTRFAQAAARQAHTAESVEAGRAAVAAYVAYVHYVETLHGLAHAPAGGEPAHAAHAHAEHGHAEHGTVAAAEAAPAHVH